MAPDIFQDYYANLGVKPNASHASIKAAFHTLAKQHHPDKSGINDATAFRRAREAYEKLSDTSFRATYDRSYWHTKLRTDGQTDADSVGVGDEGQGYTRTAQYEQEEEERGPPSPPPMKPVRKPGEPNWSYFNSKAYLNWQRQDSEHRMRHPERNEVKPSYETTNPGHTSHGLSVQMTSHPAATQRCIYRTQLWREQAGGLDYCIFCMAPTTGANRCPGCEALACKKCMHELREWERKAFGGLRSKAQYCASGG